MLYFLGNYYDTNLSIVAIIKKINVEYPRFHIVSISNTSDTRYGLFNHPIQIEAFRRAIKYINNPTNTTYTPKYRAIFTFSSRHTNPISLKDYKNKYALETQSGENAFTVDLSREHLWRSGLRVIIGEFEIAVLLEHIKIGDWKTVNSFKNFTNHADAEGILVLARDFKKIIDINLKKS